MHAPHRHTNTYCVLRENRTWFYSHVADAVGKFFFDVVRSDNILCSQCTQLAVHVGMFMHCMHCEPDLMK